MILSGIAKRYAVALFNTAIKEDIAEQVSGDIGSFATLMEANAEFSGYMGSPQVLTEDKKDLIANILGERSSGLFVKFVMLLLDKNRLSFIDEIAGAFLRLYESHQGIAEVQAITAVEMDIDLQTRTRQVVESKIGKTVRLVPITDPSIIGGMILIVDDRIVDGSVRHQLATIRKSLAKLKVH